MKKIQCRSQRGAAIVGLLIMAVILLGAFLTLNVSALLTIGNTSRALDLARQNVITASRLEQVTRESVQAVHGLAYSNPTLGLDEEIDRMLNLTGFGSAKVSRISLSGGLATPRMFPDLAGDPAPVEALNDELSQFASPVAIQHWSARGNSRVASSTILTARYEFERSANERTQTYAVEVDCTLISVPLTRNGVLAYELPSAMGSMVSGGSWPSHVSSAEMGPLGLVEGRDPAANTRLTTGPSAGRGSRPGHYRNLAAISDAFQYIFSDRYIQRVADYAGQTHFVFIGAGVANPVLVGGSESSGSYQLDISRFGQGTWGAQTRDTNVLVVYASEVGRRLSLLDSGGNNNPMLLIAAGPGGSTPGGPLELEIAGDLTRPVVIVAYNCEIVSPQPVRISGALFLDPLCRIGAGAGRFTVGHVSYSAAGPIDVLGFQLGPLPLEVEDVAPRVVYAATRRRVL